MLRIILALALFTSAVRAQDATKLPVGPPPTMVVLSNVDTKTGVLTSVKTVTEAVPVTEVREVNVAGMIQKQTVTVYKYVSKQVVIQMALDKIDVYDVKGEKVKREDALKRLGTGSVVVMSTNGEKVASAYLRILKDDTLVFVQPLTVPMPK